MAHNRFDSFSGCFNCRICGKKTRDVNGTNGSLQLCPLCQAKCESENYLTDHLNRKDAFSGHFNHCTTVAQVEELLQKFIREAATVSNGSTQVEEGDKVMSDETTAPAVESPAAESVSAPAVTKSKPKSKKKGKAVKKVAKKSKKLSARKERAPKEGLRLMQLRAIRALKASGGSLTMPQLAKKAGISPVVMRRGVGPVDASLLKKFDKEQGFPSLQTLGLVKVGEEVSANGKGGDIKETVYSLTAKGKNEAGKIDSLPKVKGK